MIKKIAVCVLSSSIVLLWQGLNVVHAGDLLNKWRARHAEPCEPRTLEELAILVDDLDKELFKDGTIGVKSPDVWGQNRMTTYRVEYENTMAKQAGAYQFVLNAALRRSDAAVLTSSTSLGFSIAPGAAGPVAAAAAPAPAAKRSSGASRTLPSTIIVNGISSSPSASAPAAASAASGSQSKPDSSSGGSSDVAKPDDLLASISDRLDKLNSNLLNLPSGILPGGPIGLEPTIDLDERSNYLYHLEQLRRVNEGDDLTDRPGYGLYLVRVPVSLLPGPSTRAGKGAQVTFEAEHSLTPDLLAQTFRNAVILDAASQLKQLVLEVYYSGGYKAKSPKGGSRQQSTDTKQENSSKGSDYEEWQRIREIYPFQQRWTRGGASSSQTSSATSSDVRLFYEEEIGPWFQYVFEAKDDAPDDQASSKALLRDPVLFEWLISELRNAHRTMRSMYLQGVGPFRAEEFKAIEDAILRRDYKLLRELRHQFLVSLILQRDPGLATRRESVRKQAIDLRQEAARLQAKDLDLLGEPLKREANQVLVKQHLASAAKLEAAFERDWSDHNLINQYLFPSEFLMYAIIVHSALAERQLREDMAVLSDRDCLKIPDLNGLWFSNPYPDPSAQLAFNAYVQAKWPLHVFAVDPVIEQQNQLDVLSMRSELELALAVAIASGQVNFKNATKYARQIQSDLATIALNRTAVGFGAGETTFGWRFMPRIQTPPLQSNPRRIADLIYWNGPGPNNDVKHRQIEPGHRECYALLVVPNFIPTVHMTSIANWFDVTGHCAEQKYMNRDMVVLSRKLQNIRAAMNHICDTEEHRPGEAARLARRVTQLETQLPTQDFKVQLPDEGDLSGSEIFNSNLAHLTPVLLSWAGEPAKEGVASSIFLLGTHFAIKDTKVIAGGIALDPPALTATANAMELMSRNVMRITIPATARTITMPNKQTFIDVHVATPNGISNHLYVETVAAAKDGGAAKSAYEIQQDDVILRIAYTLTPAVGGLAASPYTAAYSVGGTPANQHLRIKWSAPTGVAPTPINIVFNFHNNNTDIRVPLAGSVAANAAGDTYTVSAVDLVAVMTSYVTEVQKSVIGLSPANPLPSLTSVSIEITPTVPAGSVAQKVKTNNQLTVVPSLTNVP